MADWIWPYTQWRVMVQHPKMAHLNIRAKPERLKWTPEAEAMVSGNFHWFMSRFRHTTDKDGDKWEYVRVTKGIFGGRIFDGDCEDITFSLANVLLAAMVPPGCIRYVCCEIPDIPPPKNGHMVLAIDATMPDGKEDTFVLDCRDRYGPRSMAAWLLVMDCKPKSTSVPGQGLWRKL